MTGSSSVSSAAVGLSTVSCATQATIDTGSTVTTGSSSPTTVASTNTDSSASVLFQLIRILVLLSSLRLARTCRLRLLLQSCPPILACLLLALILPPLLLTVTSPPSRARSPRRHHSLCQKTRHISTLRLQPPWPPRTRTTIPLTPTSSISLSSQPTFLTQTSSLEIDSLATTSTPFTQIGPDAPPPSLR
ncbi:hypothetical protein SISSUDRAFT_1052593 [Sistotremastrum suecicum HHB10207 ss-3]|uniref:Uncharacterized protein n=1 Tax=Sistotremastrum suecicum HHB10207 ss-3 TaxID=1314776 RepID=A0A165ZSX0_9AGAM|nr:hypothetical protein SISSUDRAFT_1052593 [Sistotremastrum suecicum HHB10207 ss-3]